ncbi:MAG: hypothetical protein ABI837_03060 [Acidobacteriota bacterium]
MSTRATITAVSFITLVLCGAAPDMLMIPSRAIGPLLFDRSALQDEGKTLPGYSRFLDGVRAHTKPGDVIGLIVAPMKWQERYEYAFFRACYELVGRDVRPLIDRQSRPLPDNVAASHYLAVFGPAVRGGSFVVVWRGAGGALIERSP